jgi:hypothetical protein
LGDLALAEIRRDRRQRRREEQNVLSARVLRIRLFESSTTASLPLNAACLETWEILAAKTLS